MLNDARRNLAFKIAICTAVSAGYTSVLDIGTGTGLLRSVDLLVMFILYRVHKHYII